MIRIGTTLALLIVAAAGAQYIPSGAHIRPDPRKVEDIEWDRVKRSRDGKQLESYHNRFPKSRHAAEAQRLIDKLGEKERSRSSENGKDYKLVPQSKDVVRAVPADSK